MKFATIGHFIDKRNIDLIPKEWKYRDLFISPEIDANGTKGYLCALPLTAKQMINEPRDNIRNKILKSILFIQDELNVDVIQLGALTTSVTQGGKWLVEKRQYKGYLNHGDSYTAAVTCQVVLKALNYFNKNMSDCILSVVGSYGIIGEAVSKILVPQFKHSILVGRKIEKFENLEKILEGNFETTTDLKTKDSDIIITATSHPSALLKSNHIKKNTIVIDVSQPPNLSYKVCELRKDIHRIDGGYVSLPKNINFQIPGNPKRKIFSCIAEVIMQARENDRKNYIGTIDIKHLRKTENWGEKYGFTFQEFSNFGIPLNNSSTE
jgi:predicted amino acid dehydrogenase